MEEKEINFFLVDSTDQLLVDEEIIEISGIPQPLSFQKKMKAKGKEVFSRIAKFRQIIPKFKLILVKISLPLFSRFAFSTRGRESQIFLKERIPQGGSKNLFIVGGLVFLLIMSVFVTRKINFRQSERNEAHQILVEATRMVEESKTAVAVNPERARSLLDEANEALGKVKGLKVEKEKIGELESEIKQILEEAYNSKKITAQILVDLTLEVEEGIFRNQVLLGNKLYNINFQEQFIAETDLDTSRTSVFHLPLVGSNSKFLAGFLDHLYIYDLEQGIVSVNTVTKQAEVVIKRDPRWQNIVGFDTYLGNLYLLDGQSSQIYKYIAIPQGFSNLRNYLSSPVEVGESCDFAIDGAIYLLCGNQVEKFLGGEKVEFVLSGLYPSLDSISQVFTYPEAKKLYLRDSVSFLVFDKGGSYERRLVVEECEEIDDFVVDEERNILFFLSKNKIYQASL